MIQISTSLYINVFTDNYMFNHSFPICESWDSLVLKNRRCYYVQV